MITEKDARYSQDFDEILQLTSNVGESFDRACKILARRYHPGNQETGDPARFVQVFRAGKILSDPKPRASHDRGCEGVPTNALTPLDETSEETGYEGDQRLFDRILSLLYAKRRKNLKRSGMGIVQLEEVLGHSSEDLGERAARNHGQRCRPHHGETEPSFSPEPAEEVTDVYRLSRQNASVHLFRRNSVGSHNAPLP